MTSLPTYALLAVVATWPVFAFDLAASDQPAPPVATSVATTSPAAMVPAEPVDDQVPPPPPPPPEPTAPPPAPATKVTGTKVVKADAASMPKVVAAPAAPAAPTPPAPPAAPRAPRQFVNVDVEVSLVVRGEAVTAPRTVKLRVADGENGQYRQDMGKAILNVDVRPSIVDSSRTSVALAIEVINPMPAVPGTGGTASATELTQMRSRMEVVLKNGEATTVSQWSDGTLNRAIDVVVKATQIR